MRLDRLAIFGTAFALVGIVEPLCGPLPSEAEESPCARAAAPLPPVPAPPYLVQAPAAPALPDGVPEPPPGYTYWKTVQATVTAYDPTERCCGDSADGRTSIGDDAWVMDGVATDPQAIPYRTRLWVPGAGWREVDDTGSAMRKAWRRGRYLVDLRVPFYGQARRWGVKPLTLHLFRPGAPAPK